MLNYLDFIAGWVGGIAALVIGHPMETLKTRQQRFGTSLWSIVKHTYKYEGIMGFYKGFLIPFLIVGPSNALFFYGYAKVLDVIQEKGNIEDRVNKNDPRWKSNVAFAGLLGGTIQVIVSAPAELVKTILQANEYGHTYKSPSKAFRSIYGTAGLMGFYRGLVPVFWRDAPSSGIYTLVYESMLPNKQDADLLDLIIAGGIAGSASWSIIVPFDVIKTRMQTDDLLKPKYKGMIDCGLQLYRKQGLTVLTNGFWLTILRAFPVNAVLFSIYEITLMALKSVSKE